MGQCGCGDLNAVATRKVGNNVLAIDEYYGCKYCGNPIGIGVQIYTPEFAKDMGMEPKKEFLPGEYYSEICVRIMAWHYCKRPWIYGNILDLGKIRRNRHGLHFRTILVLS